MKDISHPQRALVQSPSHRGRWGCLDPWGNVPFQVVCGSRIVPQGTWCSCSSFRHVGWMDIWCGGVSRYMYQYRFHGIQGIVQATEQKHLARISNGLPLVFSKAYTLQQCTSSEHTKLNSNMFPLWMWSVNVCSHDSSVIHVVLVTSRSWEWTWDTLCYSLTVRRGEYGVYTGLLTLGGKSCLSLFCTQTHKSIRLQFFLHITQWFMCDEKK